VLPSGVHHPIYEIDPPDFPEEWHIDQPSFKMYEGPFGATVTLPKLLPHHLRVFTVERIYRTKRSAQSHVAFKAYMALNEAGLLSDYLLPLTSVMQPDLEGEVKKLLEDVQKRSGMETVSLQMNPWLSSGDENAELALTRIKIGSLPNLRVLTHVQPRLPPGEEVFKLYPGDRPPVEVSLESIGSIPASEQTIVKEAEVITRRLLWPLHGSRMMWKKTDFAYLLLPDEHVDDSLWAERRSWWQQVEADRGIFRPENSLLAETDQLAAAFSWPEDLVLVVDNRRPNHHRRFLSWRTEALSLDEEEKLREYHGLLEDVNVTLPLMVAQPLPKRANLLFPTTSTDMHMKEDPMLLIPNRSKAVLASETDIDYARYLPSIMRYLAMSMTLHSFRETILSNTPMANIPADILMTALTAPVSQESNNYERLETLGDCVLKFLASLQLLADFPFWHEGYLARRKDHAVSNAQLAKDAIRLKLYRWIIRDRFVPRKWKPVYLSDIDPRSPAVENGVTIDDQIDDANQKKKKEQLSTKMLADIIESLIGAAYVTGEFELAHHMMKRLELGMSWSPLPNCIEKLLSHVEPMPDFPSQLTDVELILGYEFSRKGLLIEAISHSSHQSTLQTMSYERMEFAGDAVLDMIVTNYLYNAPGKKYSVRADILDPVPLLIDVNSPATCIFANLPS
jgi:endoribonuclease Dicer